MFDQTLSFVARPSDHILQAFAAGKISEQESRQIEQHLESCAQCGARFDAISLQHDPLVERLRKTPNHSLSDTASLIADAEQSTGVFEVASTAKVRAGGPRSLLNPRSAARKS